MTATTKSTTYVNPHWKSPYIERLDPPKLCVEKVLAVLKARLESEVWAQQAMERPDNAMVKQLQREVADELVEATEVLKHWLVSNNYRWHRFHVGEYVAYLSRPQRNDTVRPRALLLDHEGNDWCVNCSGTGINCRYCDHGKNIADSILPVELKQYEGVANVY
jgi:hypothetical protein